MWWIKGETWLQDLVRCKQKVPCQTEVQKDCLISGPKELLPLASGHPKSGTSAQGKLTSSQRTAPQISSSTGHHTNLLQSPLWHSRISRKEKCAGSTDSSDATATLERVKEAMTQLLADYTWPWYETNKQLLQTLSDSLQYSHCQWHLHIAKQQKRREWLWDCHRHMYGHTIYIVWKDKIKVLFMLNSSQ